MGKKLKQKIDEAEKRGIRISTADLSIADLSIDDLLTDKKIVGIYGFFAVKEDEEHCFYIGKATNISSRLFGSSNGHIYQFLNNNYSKLVPQKINEYLNDNYKIEVKILNVINYSDTSFSKAAHRLAFVELQRIVEYQKQGQCEFQMPEGSGPYERKYWEKNYKKQ